VIPIEFYLKELHYLQDSKRRPMKIIDPEKQLLQPVISLRFFEQFSPYG